MTYAAFETIVTGTITHACIQYAEDGFIGQIAANSLCKAKRRPKPPIRKAI